jgi:phosphoglycerol transferase
LYALRTLGLSRAASLVASLLYAFAFYHFARNTGHLMLTAYYLIPLSVMVMVWVCQGSLSLEAGNVRLQNRAFAFSLLVCVLLGFGVGYYSFFFCALLLVAGAYRFFNYGNRGSIWAVLSLTGAVCLSIVVSILPTVFYSIAHGVNFVSPHAPPESEINGLKIIQLLLPCNQWIGPLKQFTAHYYASAPLVNENVYSSLGVVGSMGFLILIGRVFLKRPLRGDPRIETITHLSMLTIAAVLLATIGGFGSILAYSGFYIIRAYNRISIFICFFSLAAFFLWYEHRIKKLLTTHRGWTLTTIVWHFRSSIQNIPCAV